MRSHQQAFSLIEVLVVVSIASLLVLGLQGALASIGRASTTVMAVQRNAEDQRLVLNTLRDLLANSVPLIERRDDRVEVLFDGDKIGARFVTHLPAHASGGGLQFVEIRAEDLSASRRSSRLTLFFRAAWPETAFDIALTDAGWSREALVVDVDDVEFQYFGSPDGRSRAAWHDTWRLRERLPQLIRMMVRPVGAAWPDLVVPLRAEVSEAMPHWFRETAP